MRLKQHLSLDTSSTIRRNIANKLTVLCQTAAPVGDDGQGENVNQPPSFYCVEYFRWAMSKPRATKAQRKKNYMAVIFWQRRSSGHYSQKHFILPIPRSKILFLKLLSCFPTIFVYQFSTSIKIEDSKSCIAATLLDHNNHCV